MKSIRIGNDIRIEWPMKMIAGSEGLESFINLTVEVRPSVSWSDMRNCAPLPRDERRVVRMNGGAAGGHGRREWNDWPPEWQGREAPSPDAWRPQGVTPPPPPPPVTLRHRIEGNSVIAVWSADQQFALGDYDILLYADKGGVGQACADQCRFVRLVAHSSQADDTPCGGSLEAIVQLRPVTLSLSGLSAYDIAVLHGYEGTEKEWIESISQSCDCTRLCKEDLDEIISGEYETPTADWCEGE